MKSIPLCSMVDDGARSIEAKGNEDGEPRAL